MLLQALVLVLAFRAAVGLCGFVGRDGTDFVVDGEPFRFGGTNCYYLTYQSDFMIDDALQTAAANNFSVVRLWAYIDIGNTDGSDCADRNGPIKNGVYFQFWDYDNNKPAYNDDALKHLDNVVYKASQMGLRVLLTLTNNWSDFGGMDQYVIYKTLKDASYSGKHDDFYADDEIKQWFKDWIYHLIMRTNVYSDVKYRDDPTIFAWELANEPRCQGTGQFSTTDDCVHNYAVYNVKPTAYRIGRWVTEISAYVKSIDPNHMVATGDEGFYCNTYQQCPDWWCNCYSGVDNVAFTETADIDFMSLHMYPKDWGENADWGSWYISNHSTTAQNIGKPVLLGEFGWSDSTQSQVYSDWMNSLYGSNGNAFLFWMISGRSDDGDNYWVPNYDGFAVYCPIDGQPTPPVKDINTCPTLSKAAQQFET